MKFVLGDQLSDDCSKGGSDAGDRVRITEIARGTPMATNQVLSDLWTHRYQTAISACNVFLSLITPESELIDDASWSAQKPNSDGSQRLNSCVRSITTT